MNTPQNRSFNRSALTPPGRATLLLIAVSIGLSLLYCPAIDSLFFDDVEIFRYLGRLVASGGVPIATYSITSHR